MRSSDLLSLAASAVVALASTTAHAACDPRVVASPTHFPRTSQLRFQEGVVLLEVKVDASGRVSETQVLRSSGYDLLDRAASFSVRNRWQFDVTSCERGDLPASDRISIEYRYP